MDPYESVEKLIKKTCQLYDYTYLSLVVLTFPGVASYAMIWIFDIEGKKPVGVCGMFLTEVIFTWSVLILPRPALRHGHGKRFSI